MTQPRLSPDQRRYVQWFAKGYSMEDIADACQVPLRKIEQAVRKALVHIGGQKGSSNENS